MRARALVLARRRSTRGFTPTRHRRLTLAHVAIARARQPVESIPPFAIIVGAITAMGGLQYLTHGAAYGKPRAIGQDAFDRLVAARDERVKTAAASGRGAQK